MPPTGGNIAFPHVFQPLFSPYRYKVFYGGRGGGRSWSFARALLIKAAVEDNLRILCAREYQKSISDSVMRLLSDQIVALGLEDYFEVQKSMIKGVNGSLFIFEGLSQNVTKVKSLEGIDICWVEEAEKVSENSWDVLIPTIRKEGSEIWISFNPDLETDPTYVRFVKNTPPDSYVKKTSWRDNKFLPLTLRKEKDYLYATDPDRADHVWGGNCRSHSDAQIMKGKWSIRAFEPEADWDGPYYGADWGFSQDPTAVVKFWFDSGGFMYVEEEAFGYGVDLDDLPNLFDSISGIKDGIIFGDCSRPETISHLVRKGYNVKSAQKWPNSVEEGIVWLRGLPGIIIHDRCKEMISEARNWSYKVDRLTGLVTTKIVPGFDHGWDALRYGCAKMIRSKLDFIFETDY